MSETTTFVISMMLITDPAHAPEGPGWYMLGTDMKPRRINLAQAEEIARAFEGTIPAGDETVKMHPFEIVKQGTLKAQESAKQELEKAERIATRIPQLRRNLGDLGVQ